jgi:5-methylcytosine-specific restriction endonuclease McrA
MTTAGPRKANAISGHRWAKARRRVLRTEDVCAECGEAVDKSLPVLDPMAPQVDHRQPIALGGDPFARENVALVHRRCNRAKGISAPMAERLRASSSREW